MSELPQKILPFDILRVEYGRHKICQCTNPHYEIDTQNRLVICADCNAVIDPFNALVDVAKHYDRIQRWTQSALEQRREIENYKPHLVVIKELESRYRSGKMVPCCPCCGEPFDLKQINHWCSRKFLKVNDEKEATPCLNAVNAESPSHLPLSPATVVEGVN